MGTLNSTKITVDLLGSIRKSLDIVGNKDISLRNDSYVKSLATGTGAGLADMIFVDSITGKAAAGSESYDLSGGLVDVFGDATVFVKVKAVLIHNKSDERATPTTAIIGVDGNWITTTFGASTDIPIAAGDIWLWTAQSAGVAVTDTSADVITVTNNDGTDAADWDIMVIGTSA